MLDERFTIVCAMQAQALVRWVVCSSSKKASWRDMHWKTPFLQQVYSLSASYAVVQLVHLLQYQSPSDFTS